MHFGSPKLLILSDIRLEQHLRQSAIEVKHVREGVGSNLQDHLDLFAIAERTGQHTYDHYSKPLPALCAGLQYLLLKNGQWRQTYLKPEAFGIWMNRQHRQMCNSTLD